MLHSYDHALQPGDFVTGYAKGIHQIVEICPREGNAPLVKLIQVLSLDFRKVPKRKSICDISYCNKVTKDRLISWVEDYYQAGLADINEVIQ